METTATLRSDAQDGFPTFSARPPAPTPGAQSPSISRAQGIALACITMTLLVLFTIILRTRVAAALFALQVFVIVR